MSEEKKNEILNEKLDKEEMDAVTGGGLFGARGSGGCAKDFFGRTCTATVEKGSWCHSNDYCEAYSETYRHVEAPQPRTW